MKCALSVAALSVVAALAIIVTNVALSQSGETPRAMARVSAVSVVSSQSGAQSTEASAVSSGAASSAPPSTPASSAAAAASSDAPLPSTAAPPPAPASAQAVAQPTVTVTQATVDASSQSVASSAVQLGAPASPWADTGLQGISKVYEYGKTLLTAEEQGAYDVIAKSVHNMDAQVTFAAGGMSAADIETVISYYWEDHADVFYLSAVRIGVLTDRETSRTYYRIGFTYAYDQAKVGSMRGSMEAGAAAMITEAMKALGASSQDASNQLNVEKALHDTLVGDTSYDMAEYSNPGSNLLDHTAYNVFASYSAVCDGYSKALKLLLDSQGIASIVVDGTVTSGGQTGGHAWNRAKVGGVWDYLDATFDDPVDLSNSSFSTVSHRYFNSPALWPDHTLGLFNTGNPFDVNSENYSVMP